MERIGTKLYVKCTGKVLINGCCDQCYQPINTTSSPYCGRYIEVEVEPEEVSPPLSVAKEDVSEKQKLKRKFWIESSAFMDSLQERDLAPEVLDFIFDFFYSEIEKRDKALNKINGIRNSIIGLQKINWSEHIYPLVAALNEADIQGMEYNDAREHFGTMLERTNKAEQELASLRKAMEEKDKVLEETDFLLAMLEDSAHGKEGKLLTEMRGKIQAALDNYNKLKQQSQNP